MLPFMMQEASPFGLRVAGPGEAHLLGCGVPAVEPLAPGALAASAILLGSVLAMWLGVELWTAATAATVVAAYVSGIMHGTAALWLGAFAWCAWRLRWSIGWRRAAWGGATALLGLFLGVHLLPGFTNPVVM